MAKNVKYRNGDELYCILTYPASGGKSGDPGMVNDTPCVLQTDQDANNGASVKFSGVITIPVKGVNAGGNSAVAKNDRLYFNSGDTPPVSKKVAGLSFGLALATVGSGSTTSIDVRLGK